MSWCLGLLGGIEDHVMASRPFLRYSALCAGFLGVLAFGMALLYSSSRPPPLLLQFSPRIARSEIFHSPTYSLCIALSLSMYTTRPVA